MQLQRLLGLLGIGTMAVLAGAAACGGDDGTGGSGGSGTGTGTGTGTGAGMGGAGTGTATGMGGGMTCDACSPPDPAHEEILYTVGGNVTGNVLDQNGDPAADIVTDVCGTNLCLFGSADATGTFTVPGNDSELEDVRLLYGNGKRFAKMGARLPNCDQTNCDGPQVGTINTINLPDFSVGVDLTPGSDVSQGGTTLSVPAESCFKYDLILYEEGEFGFRSTVLDYGASGLTLPAVDQANLGNEVVLVATAPINTVICPAAPMEVELPASTAWTEGTEVELYLHGTKTFQHYVPYGEWSKHGEGVVTANGTVTTNAGSEIEFLGLYAIRPKP